MASIRRLRETNGKVYYEFTVSLGKDLNGKYIRRYKQYELKSKEGTKGAEKELNREAIRFEDEVKNNKYFDDNKITYQDYAKKYWLEGYAKVRLTEPQQQQYWDTLEKYIFPKIGMLRITQIRAQQVQSVINEMSTAGLSLATIKRRCGVMRSVFNFAYKMSVIGENPCNRWILPKEKRKGKRIHTFNIEQTKSFLNYLDKEHAIHYPERKRKRRNGSIYTVREYISHIKYDTWIRCYFYLATFGGFRRGEEVALTWKDIDFNKKTVSITKAAKIMKVNGKNTVVVQGVKTEAGYRVITLPDICFDYLRELYSESKKLCERSGTDWKGKPLSEFEDNSIFIKYGKGCLGERIALDTPYQAFKRILKTYNEDPENRDNQLPADFRLHDLRHTSASLLLEGGADLETVKDRLGHAKASTTLDFYAEALPGNDSKASEILEKELVTENISESQEVVEAEVLTQDEVEILRKYRESKRRSGFSSPVSA